MLSFNRPSNFWRQVCQPPTLQARGREFREEGCVAQLPGPENKRKWFPLHGCWPSIGELPLSTKIFRPSELQANTLLGILSVFFFFLFPMVLCLLFSRKKINPSQKLVPAAPCCPFRRVRLGFPSGDHLSASHMSLVILCPFPPSAS